jgi:hypothetical protein
MSAFDGLKEVVEAGEVGNLQNDRNPLERETSGHVTGERESQEVFVSPALALWPECPDEREAELIGGSEAIPSGSEGNVVIVHGKWFAREGFEDLPSQHRVRVVEREPGLGQHPLQSVEQN